MYPGTTWHTGHHIFSRPLAPTAHTFCASPSLPLPAHPLLPEVSILVSVFPGSFWLPRMNVFVLPHAYLNHCPYHHILWDCLSVHVDCDLHEGSDWDLLILQLWDPAQCAAIVREQINTQRWLESRPSDKEPLRVIRNDQVIRESFSGNAESSLKEAELIGLGRGLGILFGGNVSSCIALPSWNTVRGLMKSIREMQDRWVAGKHFILWIWRADHIILSTTVQR